MARRAEHATECIHDALAGDTRCQMRTREPFSAVEQALSYNSPYCWRGSLQLAAPVRPGCCRALRPRTQRWHTPRAVVCVSAGLARAAHRSLRRLARRVATMQRIWIRVPELQRRRRSLARPLFRRATLARTAARCLAPSGGRCAAPLYHYGQQNSCARLGAAQRRTRGAVQQPQKLWRAAEAGVPLRCAPRAACPG